MTWIQRGIRPDAVLGTGPGTLAAAAVAKALPVTDAVGILLGMTSRPPGAALASEASLTAAFAAASLRPPKVPVVSAALGRALTDGEVTDPGHWARAALCEDETLIGRGLSHLLGGASRILLEASGHRPLLTLAATRPECTDDHLLLPVPVPSADDTAAELDTLGRLWLNGAAVRWHHVHGGRFRRRVPLPAYPYERERFLVEPAVRPAAEDTTAGSGTNPRTSPGTQETGRPEVLPTLLGLYAEILGFAEVSASDNFFDLGGDSLVASRLVERIREVFPVDIDVLSVFEAPEPAELATTIEALLTA
jgi:acyl transferase domain-containing protein